MTESRDALPGSAALQGLMDDLDKMLGNLHDTQRRMMSLSGVGWSDDRMVKAEVGPRGQLTGLQIDPRALRRPDARALEASVLAAVAAAVRQVVEQTQETVLGEMAPDLAELRAQSPVDETDPLAQMLRTDAEIMAERRRTGG
jgi:hypothetical protein